MSYALVQKSLEQTIDRKNLEEASVHVLSVARGDCARLHRDLFGIVVNGLSHDEAIAFQVALEYFRFPTEIVPDAEIPRLPEPVIRRGIRFSAEELVALDGLGRENRYPWGEVQFAVGGFLETQTVTALEFRLELYLSCEPYRLQFRAGKDTLFRCDDAMLRFRERAPFDEILRQVARILPKERQGLGIKATNNGLDFLYPNPSALEEETTWHLLRQLRR